MKQRDEIIPPGSHGIADDLPSPAGGAHRYVMLMLAALFLGLLVTPGLYHAAFGVSSADAIRWKQWLRTENTLADAFRLIEIDFDRRFLPARAARQRLAGWVAPAADSSRVRKGADGFLFLDSDERVAYVPGLLEDPRSGRGARAAEAIVDLSRQLRRRRIDLLVVPIPAKASIYPDRLDPSYDTARGPNLNIHFDQWMRRLEQGGVETLDLTGVFWKERFRDGADPLFARTDSHWTGRGVALAAGEIARTIGARVADVEPIAFEVRSATFPRTGDLRQLASNMGDLDEPDMVERRMQLIMPDGTYAAPGDDAAVLLIGDSYAALFESSGAGLSQHIMAELRRPVQSAALVGTTGDQMRDILRTNPRLLQNKRVVVFAFTMRMIVEFDWSNISLD